MPASAASVTGEPAADAPTVDVTMPQMGVSVAEGTVVAWHKRVGDPVEVDETVCEISTDKIDSEVPAPAAGRLTEILVEVEQTVPVGSVLARIATVAAADAGPPAAAERPSQDEPPPAAESASAQEASPAATAQAGAELPPSEPGHHVHYSPVVQRIARSEGVDLELVHGTGRGGRVRKQDVLAFVHRRGNGNGSAGDAERAQPPLHIESPYREPEAPEPGLQGAPSEGPGGAGPEQGERLSRMRRSIASHMLESLRTAAHCTSIAEADMSAVQAARETLGLTYLPFVARCAIDALRAHPDLNATLEGESLTRHRSVNLGIAVSLDRDGLIVPVIHDAQELSYEGLAGRIADLARRARAGQLGADEVRGGTFTITNPGAYGTLASTPIINQPQVAILDLEAVVKRPVVVDDGAGGEAIAIRPMAYLCLSWDHRALDGALAAQFLGTLRRLIETWGGAR
jgi:2-oxoglutarate dehydrogenase E2 component (dihydrolipoamide succinyltransferase)